MIWCVLSSIVDGAAKEVNSEWLSQSLIRVERSERSLGRPPPPPQPEGRKEWIIRKEEEELKEAVRGNKKRPGHILTHSLSSLFS